MSIISSPLPEFVEAEGLQYPIYTDFRVWLEYSRLLQADMPLKEKLGRIFLACYINKLPSDAETAIKALAGFYTCNSTGQKRAASGGAKKTARYFDFEEDAGYIFAAFMSEYGINLQTARLHWWEFISLFSALGEGCLFSKIVSYRMANPEKIKNEEQKKFIRKMQRIYRLPDRRPAEEKEAEFAGTLWNL